MAIRSRTVSRVTQPQGLLQLRDGPFSRNSIVWTASNPYTDIGTRNATPVYNGAVAPMVGTDGPAIRHTTTNGSDSLVFASPAGVEDGFAVVLRFMLESSSQTTLFNSLNEATTVGATQIRTSSASLQFVQRDASVRFTSAGVPLVVGKWHTVAFRQGVYQKAVAGRISGRMWIDGVYVGTFNTASTAVLVNGDFAVACGRYASDTAQSRSHQVSLAAIAFDSADDEFLKFASARPFDALFKERRILVPVSAGGTPVSIDGNVGAALAAGLGGNVASSITVAGNAGAAVAAGIAGTVVSPVTIAGTVGQATAAGLAGTVASPVSISGQTGEAVAAGLQGTVASGATVAGNIGAATAAGLTGTVASSITIAGQVGAASAAGLAGTVSTDNSIIGQVGRAQASGLPGVVSSPVTISGNVGAAVASGLAGTVAIGATIQGNTGAAVALGLAGTVANAAIIVGAVGRALARGLQGLVSTADVAPEQLGNRGIGAAAPMITPGRVGVPAPLMGRRRVGRPAPQAYRRK